MPSEQPSSEPDHATHLSQETSGLGLLARIASRRIQHGLLTPDQVYDLGEGGVIAHDVLSVMISRHVRFTGRATLYPGVIIECDASSTCTIGDGVVLYPGVRIVAAYGGSVSLGAGVLMGEGGGSEARADRPGSAITIADRARLTHGAQVLGHSDIGVGAQIIGQIVAQSVTLADGEDSSFPDPDRRGGVLKGIGIARSLSVGVGEVVNGLGDFSQARAERQRSYHPDAPGA